MLYGNAKIPEKCVVWLKFQCEYIEIAALLFELISTTKDTANVCEEVAFNLITQWLCQFLCL